MSSRPVSYRHGYRYRITVQSIGILVSVTWWYHSFSNFHWNAFNICFMAFIALLFINAHFSAIIYICCGLYCVVVVMVMGCHSNGTGVTATWTTGCRSCCEMVGWLRSSGTRWSSVTSSRWKTISLSLYVFSLVFSLTPGRELQVSTKKTKPTVFLAYHHQTATKCSNFFSAQRFKKQLQICLWLRLPVAGAWNN